jgi:hypothetical protein
MKKLLLVFLIVSGFWNAFAQNGEAGFLELRGTVEIQEANSGEWRRAAPGMRIRGNTVISTGLKSSAVIAAGSSRLELGPLTMLTLTELIQRSGGEETTLYLRTGRVRASVTPPTGQNVDFTIGSPTVTASVRGTSFEFDGKRLKVASGQVLLTGAGGQKVYVAGTQQSYVDENNQNRIVPPFETEAALLRPVIPELNNTGSVTRHPEIGAFGPGVRLYIGWP